MSKALDLLTANPARDYSVGELAAECGVAARTLQKHFKRFLGRTPGDVVRDLRLERVRHELLQASPQASVTESAIRWRVGHLGRFSASYRRRYGETPSATLRRRRGVLTCHEPSPIILSPTLDRPVIHVRPFDLTGRTAQRADTIADTISASLLRNRWLAVSAPARARYQLHGRVRDDGSRHLQALVVLSDRATGRHLWADRWDGKLDDVFAFEHRVASGVATAVERSLRLAEVARVRDRDPAELGAWDLTMRALPLAMRIEAAAQSRALELLERAMELAPRDALPVALAGLNSPPIEGAHFSRHILLPKQGSQRRTVRAEPMPAMRGRGVVGAAQTLAHELTPAAVHFDRALALDGGCVWAWNRSGWLNVYRGLAADAIECFQIARSLDPTDPLNFFCSIGIAAAHFEIGSYAEAAKWFGRGLAEHPQAVWSNRFRAPALALAGNKEEAQRSFAELVGAYPDLTIAQVRSALPHTARFYDRASEGLADLGMRP
jgi:AraC-like DNA-binding protein/tetratricopeptide (TPR) repeat protein